MDLTSETLSDTTNVLSTKEATGLRPLTLVVIIPCLNEENTVAEVIENIPRDIDGIKNVRILVVDDGSRDRTSAIAHLSGASVLKHPTPVGLGRTFRDGINEAIKMGADLIVNIDGDGQFDPQDIPKLIQPILSEKADFVTASRFKTHSNVPEMPTIRKWGNAQMARFIGWLTGETFSDVSCGFRAYNREAALHLNLIGKFTYTQETFLDLFFKGLKIEEVPVMVRGTRAYGKSRVASNLFLYGIRTFLIIIRTFRDYQPMLFFGAFSLLNFLAAGALGVFLLIHFTLTGSFSPHKWAGVASAFFAIASLMSFMVGLSADMMNRLRITQERILHLLRSRE